MPDSEDALFTPSTSETTRISQDDYLRAFKTRVWPAFARNGFTSPELALVAFMLYRVNNTLKAIERKLAT